jgi:hypothetical protein
MAVISQNVAADANDFVDKDRLRGVGAWQGAGDSLLDGPELAAVFAVDRSFAVVASYRLDVKLFVHS